MRELSYMLQAITAIGVGLGVQPVFGGAGMVRRAGGADRDRGHEHDHGRFDVCLDGARVDLRGAKTKSMKPMEAWRIIEKDLKALFALRYAQGMLLPRSREEAEAEVLAFKALKEMDERSGRDEAD